MAIPLTIYQTFKTQKLPFLNRWFINKIRKRNPEYSYEFFDDERIELFIAEEFGQQVLSAYKKIKIGAAKADFFRYAILYKKGGVYLDIDSYIPGKLSQLITTTDAAIISKEDHGDSYVQWALLYEAGHPFLRKTLDLILQNIEQNKFANDILNFSGPKVYTKAINECLTKDPSIPYRISGIDYEGNFRFQFPFSKFFLYKKNEHWTKQQKVIKAFE